MAAGVCHRRHLWLLWICNRSIAQKNCWQNRCSHKHFLMHKSDSISETLNIRQLTMWCGWQKPIYYSCYRKFHILYHGVIATFQTYCPNLTSLAGCRTWCPTDLQHLCCKALINKIKNKLGGGETLVPKQIVLVQDIQIFSVSYLNHNKSHH